MAKRKPVRVTKMTAADLSRFKRSINTSILGGKNVCGAFVPSPNPGLLTLDESPLTLDDQDITLE